MIFQDLLESGVVAEDWKFSNVTPLFKKEARREE